MFFHHSNPHAPRSHVFQQVRFELKTDKGSYMVSVEPPAEEMVFPQPVSTAEFERVLASIGQLDKETAQCQVSPTNGHGMLSRIFFLFGTL